MFIKVNRCLDIQVVFIKVMEVEGCVVSLNSFLVQGSVVKFSMMLNYVMNGRLLNGMRSFA